MATAIRLDDPQQIWRTLHGVMDVARGQSGEGLRKSREVIVMTLRSLATFYEDGRFIPDPMYWLRDIGAEVVARAQEERIATMAAEFEAKAHREMQQSIEEDAQREEESA